MNPFFTRICAVMFAVCCTVLGVGLGKAIQCQDLTEYFSNPIKHTFQMIIDIWDAY